MADSDEVDARGPFNEWHTLVVGLPGALVTGFIYAYSTYANALSSALGLSEDNKETIGLAPSICKCVRLHSSAARAQTG